jgi:hypothetical protein
MIRCVYLMNAGGLAGANANRWTFASQLPAYNSRQFPQPTIADRSFRCESFWRTEWWSDVEDSFCLNRPLHRDNLKLSSVISSVYFRVKLNSEWKKTKLPSPSWNHRLYTWRWSFSGARELRYNFKPQFTSQQWSRGHSCNKKLKNTNLKELGVRKPLVVSTSQRSKELRLYNLV